MVVKEIYGHCPAQLNHTKPETLLTFTGVDTSDLYTYEQNNFLYHYYRSRIIKTSMDVYQSAFL